MLASYLYILIALVYNVLRNSIVFDWVELKQIIILKVEYFINKLLDDLVSMVFRKHNSIQLKLFIVAPALRV